MIDDHEKQHKHIHFELPSAFNTIPMTEIRTPREVFLRKKMTLNLSDNSFEDGKKTKFLNGKLWQLDWALLILSTIGIFAGVMFCNVPYPNQELDFMEEQIFWANYLCWLCFISTILLIGVTFVYYKLKLELRKEQRSIYKSKTFYTSGFFWHFMIEVLIVAPCPLPFLLYDELKLKDFITGNDVQWRWNYALSVYTLLRILVLSRIFFGIFEFGDQRTSRICQMFGVNSGFFFVMRCTLKKHLFYFLVFAICVIILAFAHAVKTTEKSLNTEPGVVVGITNYFNAFWCIIVTMTTVGYGDYFPKSIPGRVIVFCVCILGTTLISLIVFLMTGFLEMTEAETKVMNIVIRMQKREGIKKEAAFVLSTVAKLALVTRKMKKETDLIKKEIISKEVVIMQEKVKLHFERFRRFTRELRDMGDGFSLSENMTNQFALKRFKFMEILEKQKKLDEINQRINLALDQDQNRLLD